MPVSPLDAAGSLLFTPSSASRWAAACWRALSAWSKGRCSAAACRGNCLLQETAFICPMELSKGCATAVRRLNHRVLLCRSDAALYLAQNLPAFLSQWA